MKYDARRAREAVQFLVNSPYFIHHVAKLRTTVKKPRALPFKDAAEPLNELLVIGRQNPQAMENLIEVAQSKRDDRNDYQRHYMAAKRQRDRKVIQLEELLAGKTLTNDQRNHLLHRQYQVWNKERGQYLTKQGDVSWLERNEKIREFWHRKEAEIDALIEEAQKNPHKRKRVVVVEKQPKTDFGRKLQKAVKPVDRRR